LEVIDMSRYERQSFLGPESESDLGAARAGIVGLGGGGSHIAQQLAHIGIGRFVLSDIDRYEDKNHNRTVGGLASDIDDRTLKVRIAERTVLAVNPQADVFAVEGRWQTALPQLRECDVVFGCVDSYTERDQLEDLCRRYLIPYIDIGMDVHQADSGYAVQGQVILSMPGDLCLRCFDFLRQDLLDREARRYGKAGGRPQVIWPNGVLASTAVGLFIELMSPWHPASRGRSVMYDYDGNRHTMTVSSRAVALEGVVCHHFRDAHDVGNPFWKPDYIETASAQAEPARLGLFIQWLRGLFRRS
jgi:molybdopterin/thiamine biosynthesis adenylyltransferase